MKGTPVIAVFDVGKTNKKLFLFDEHYHIVYEEAVKLPESTDEDNFPTEDLGLLSHWVDRTFLKLLQLKEFDIRAVNFSAYGASFVHLDNTNKPVTPLYNYLKPFPEELKQQFFKKYGGEEAVSLQTASPVLGSLNSGMQLYRLKEHQPEVYRQIDCSLHLPQYLSFLITGEKYTDITSIGCHTGLWNFQKNDYHNWVYSEEINLKFAPVYKGSDVVKAETGTIVLPVGVGLHDSSAALIPYLTTFQEPFILISTGTWCISLNPFNQSALTPQELQQDCLCYMQYEGEPIKASRFFGGYEHEQQSNRIASHFNLSPDFYKKFEYNAEIGSRLQKRIGSVKKDETDITAFGKRDLADFHSAEEAYHQLIFDIIRQQVASTQMVLKETNVKRIFVDGGFSKNNIFMHALAAAFPRLEVFAASMAQATAIGAALAIHKHWNKRRQPGDIIELKYYAVAHDTVL